MTDDDAKTEGRKMSKLTMALILTLQKRDKHDSWCKRCKTCGKRRKAWEGICDECARMLEEEIARMSS